MVKVKGIYYIKLWNPETGHIEKEFEQDNLITDAGLTYSMRLGANEYSGVFSMDWSYTQVFLSDSTPTPGVDYRLVTSGTPFNVLVSLYVAPYPINTIGYSQCEINIAPGVSSRTVKIIGLRSNSNTMLSFIELSTPITQTTNLYLFVRYRAEWSYTGGTGYNAISNQYVSNAMNSCGWQSGSFVTMFSYSSQTFYTTVLKKPLDYSKVARSHGASFPLTNKPVAETKPGLIAFSAYDNKTISQNPGVYGSGFTYNPAAYLILGIQDYPTTVQKSIVFFHAANDPSIFSNPGTPPNSVGSLLITGTSNSSTFFKVTGILISSTGDASDISNYVNNTFTVTTGTEELTVSQDWDNSVLGNIVTCEVSSDGTLPSPLLASITYYVIYVDSTTIKLAYTLSDAQNNIPIDITTSGSGTHRVFRRSAAKIKLAIGSPLTGYSTLGTLPLKNGSSWFNSRGECFPSPRGTPEYLAWTAYCPTTNMTYYHYKTSPEEGSKHLICKWNFWTLESGQDIIERSTNRGVYSANYIWMATNTGLARLDVTNDTIVDYTVSNGLLATICTDVAIDEATGILWIGHANGLTSFNTSTFTVIATHTNGTGNVLDGLTNTDIVFEPGRIKVYNNILVRTPIRTFTSNSVPWVYNVTSGDYMKIPSSTWTGGNDYDLVFEVVGEGERLIMAQPIAGYSRYKELNCNITANTLVVVSTTDLRYGYSTPRLNRITRWNNNTFLTYVVDPSSLQQHFIETFKRVSSTITRGTANISSGEHNTSWYEKQSSHSMIDGVLCLFHGNTIMFPNILLEYGCTYTGGNYVWSREDTNAIELPNSSTSEVFSHSSFTTLANNLVFNPENAGGFNSNLQFIAGENAILTHGPGMIKTNLQTASFYATQYFADLKKIVKSINVPSGAPYTFTIDQAPAGATPVADFKGMEARSYYLTVNHSSEGNYLQVSSNPTNKQYVATEAGLFTFSSADAGKPLNLTFYYVERH